MIAFDRTWFQQKLNNFVNWEYFFIKLSSFDPCEKRINILGRHSLATFFMVRSKLEAKAIYVLTKTGLWQVSTTYFLHSTTYNSQQWSECNACSSWFTFKNTILSLTKSLVKEGKASGSKNPHIYSRNVKVRKLII